MESAADDDIWQRQRPPEEENGPPFRLLMIDANDFGRSCSLASLSGLPALDVAAFAEIAQAPQSLVPDVVLFQDNHDRPDAASVCGLLKEARARWADTILAVVSNHAEQIAQECARCGAQILMESNIRPETIVDAVRLAGNGMGVLPFGALKTMPKAAEGEGVDLHGGPATGSRARAIKRLTRRQRDVLKALTLGQSNREIARQLSISESTVKVHIRAIMGTVGVINRTQLVAHFLTER